VLASRDVATYAYVNVSPHRTGRNRDGMTSRERTWTITELAAEHGVTLRTLRFYEDEGLLSPERRGSQRVFHPRDSVRLGLVLRGRRLGFPLAEIKKIVGMYDEQPGEVGQLHYLLEQIAHRRAELEGRRKDIEQTLGELDDVERRCREDLQRLAAEPTVAR
jgi:DNA-binding transcriptional MerR regulator